MQLKDLQPKRTLRTVLLVLLLGAVGMTKGYAVTIGDLNYSLNSITLTATVTAHKDGWNATGSLVIPSSVTYTDYEEINGHYVLVTRTYTVTTIGDYAFQGCSGFTGSLTIPNSVITIEDFAFQGCSGFTGSLTIPNSVTTIGGCAFYGCSGFTGSLTIPDSVTLIGGRAFYGCRGITGSLTIGNYVNEAIADTTTIIISGYSLGGSYDVFGYCDFAEIIVEPLNTLWDSRDSCNAIIETNTNTLIRGCRNTIIPNSVTSILEWAFTGCSGFTSITIPSSVNSIRSGAFRDCNDLVSVIMEATVPPQLNENTWHLVFPSSNPKFTIYVPWESVDDYKTAWSNYEPYIKPMHILSVLGYDYGVNSGVIDEMNDKWTFIALPLVEDVAPTEVLNLLSEDGGYDLYQFDQSANDEEWRNYKIDSFNLVNGRGYLYATAVNLNLLIGGEFNEDETKVVSLDYDAGKPLAGWNLVGNPFPCNAYINREYYVMNEEGTGINPVAVSASTPIPPCKGVMVKAESEGETVVFSRAAP